MAHGTLLAVSKQIHTVGMSWQHAGLLGLGLFALGLALSPVAMPALRWLGPALRECGIIAGLYGLWVLAGRVSVVGAAGGYARAKWILHAEHDLRIPSEHHLQRLVAQVCNLYYDTMHFTMVFVFLIWLFFRHRDQYAPMRRVLAFTTLFCLMLQLLPVAPPRLMPGFTDTAAVYGQSVYAGGLAADQLSAMPSVHVAWAVLVGWGVVRVSTSPWRWIAVAHPVITVFVVVATANHYWADGIVAVAILVLCVQGQRAITALWMAIRTRHAEPTELRSAPLERILP
jgi:hypothetical protein